MADKRVAFLKVGGAQVNGNVFVGDSLCYVLSGCKSQMK